MRITISPAEIIPGDIYRGKRIVYVVREGDHVYLDYENGGSATFLESGQIEVDRKIETVNIEKG